jgi:hypothetical protein
MIKRKEGESKKTANRSDWWVSDQQKSIRQNEQKKKKRKRDNKNINHNGWKADLPSQ